MWQRVAGHGVAFLTKTLSLTATVYHEYSTCLLYDHDILHITQSKMTNIYHKTNNRCSSTLHYWSMYETCSLAKAAVESLLANEHHWSKKLSEHCEGSGNTKLLTRWNGQYSLKHLIIDYNDLFSDAASCSFSEPTVSKICALLKAAESWHLMFDYCDVFSDVASCSFSEPTVSKICALLKAVGPCCTSDSISITGICRSLPT